MKVGAKVPKDQAVGPVKVLARDAGLDGECGDVERPVDTDGTIGRPWLNVAD